MGDQAHRRQSEVIRECAPQAQHCTHRRYCYKERIDEAEGAKNRTTSVRSKVEHVFAVMKLKFGFVKLRYRGPKKNANQLFAVCALVNVYLLRRKLCCSHHHSPLRRLLITGHPKRAATGEIRIRTLALGWLNRQHLKDTGLFRKDTGLFRVSLIAEERYPGYSPVILPGACSATAEALHAHYPSRGKAHREGFLSSLGSFPAGLSD